MDNPPIVLLFLAVFFFMITCITGIWWLQSTAAERGRRANPDPTDRVERLEELESERQVAAKVVRIVAPMSAVAFVVVLLLAFLA